MTIEQAHEQLKLAEEAQNKGNYDEAERIANEVLTSFVPTEEDPNVVLLHASASRLLGIVAWRRDNYPTALKFFNKALDLAEEINDKELIAKAINGIGTVNASISDYPKALDYFTKALNIYEELANKNGIANNLGNIGNVYENLSDYPKALEYLAKALTIYEELGSKYGIAKNLLNIGTVYQNISEYPKALEYYAKALVINEELNNKNGVASNLTGIGIVYHSMSDYPKALEHHIKGLAINKELGNKNGIAVNLGNIGNVYDKLSDFTNALEYHIKALVINEEIDNKNGIAINLGNIGNVYGSLSEYEKALEFYSRALAVCEEIGAAYPRLYWLLGLGTLYAIGAFDGYNRELAESYLKQAIADSLDKGVKNITRDAYHALYVLYKHEQQWQESLEAKEKHEELEKEINLEEAKKKAEQMDYERKTAEREKQLAVERAAATARIEEQQKLIHNVLPPAIAERLLNNETFIADSYPNVSVLFMDLVNFTRIAAIIPPRHLIYLLNTIFSNADAVMEKHGLEKIKTIGDAYMAVAGAPVHQEDHAQRAALASLELLDSMNNLSINIPSELGSTLWIERVGEINVRIGLHIGEAIGGVIGDKKFSFDLWGDAVNTASRMESHGEAGKIHCSEEFKNAVVQTQHAVSLQFIPRGEMEIKGKGTMRTYFLEKNV